MNFDKQILHTSNANWALELEFHSCISELEHFDVLQFNTVINLNETIEKTGSLSIKSTSNDNKTLLTLIEGIYGGAYLYTSNESDISQSVKLNENILILSLVQILFHSMLSYRRFYGI